MEQTWIHNTLKEIAAEISMPSSLWSGNQAAINISNNPVFHEHTKHVEVHFHVL